MRRFTILLVIVVFFVCLFIGYSLMKRIDNELVAGVNVGSNAGGNAEQHNLILIQVDQLNSEAPKLESVWFVSLYFLESYQPIVTFAQLYPTLTPTGTSQALERTFAFDHQGEPAAAFWRVFRANSFEWEGYFLIDREALEMTLGWLHGPGLWTSALSQQEESKSIILQTCQALTGLPDRTMEKFRWSEFAPAHFRSNMKMEVSLSYWDRLVTSQQPIRCEVVLAK